MAQEKYADGWGADVLFGKIASPSAVVFRKLTAYQTVEILRTAPQDYAAMRTAHPKRRRLALEVA